MKKTDGTGTGKLPPKVQGASANQNKRPHAIPDGPGGTLKISGRKKPL